ncbi:hypothetical protein JTE90_007242 [Oedothorax gibbosus]|uniref:Apoptosis regulatory protein Siva n=1 Tax=Oedothorax gibbosus TaxID=931172 RepID=A0AAV6VLI7_9ARAC|nr:hypothetical protein JTE90_007242 [Oedothorax gibbosus]
MKFSPTCKYITIPFKEVMPKRKSCFDELPILSKMHVGEKEVDLGVNFETNMSKVFEKTHALLFNANSNGLHSLPNGDLQTSDANFAKDSLHPAAKASEKKIADAAMNSCCLSQQTLPCYFCEKKVCPSCCRMCHNCTMPFCHLCSIMQYSSHEETALCLSCL